MGLISLHFNRNTISALLDSESCKLTILIDPPVLPPILLLSPPPRPASSSSSLLVPVSPAAHPQSAPSGRGGSPLDCQSPAPPWRVKALSLPPASEPWNPPRFFDPAAPPWLLAPSSPPWPGIPPAPPGSLIPLAPPWSVVDHPHA